MITRMHWAIRQMSRRLWFRASLLSLLAGVAALAALIVAPYIPVELPGRIGADAVDSILQIIASSMLAVTTFSLSTMVAAYAAASSGVTPRAAKLLMADTASQNMLATFIGSFLYSLVAIVALSTGAYGQQGRVVLFGTTIAVIILIVVTLLRWIDHLTRLGRVGETTQQVEEAAAKAFRARLEEPYLGGMPLDPERAGRRPGTRPVFPVEVGYVQHIDMAALQNLLRADDDVIEIVAIPGSFVDPARPLAWLPMHPDAELLAAAAKAFVIAGDRSFDQDPRFGMSVLAEIASRALSPAVNDPGTAIDVIGRAVRILSLAADQGLRACANEPRYPGLLVPPVRTDELFDDIFTPIARDGAAFVEVQTRLHKAFQALVRLGAPAHAQNALRHARLALARAEPALSLDEDKQVLRRLVAQLEADTSDGVRSG